MVGVVERAGRGGGCRGEGWGGGVVGCVAGEVELVAPGSHLQFHITSLPSVLGWWGELGGDLPISGWHPPPILPLPP